MRKTSQDGDSLSVTSGADIENKTIGKKKTKRMSLKRTVESLSQDAADGVAEPLLQNDNVKIDFGSQSAKCVLAKLKTSSICEQDNEENNLVTSKKMQTSVENVGDNLTNTSLDTTALIHNHTYDHTFGDYEGLQSVPAPKNHVLVDIDTTKSKAYTPSPMIFTTAKIHFEGTSKLMEPLHVTPVPIASTIEGQVRGEAAIKKVINKNSEISELKPLKKDDTSSSNNSTGSDLYYSGLVQSSSTLMESDKDLEKTSKNKIKTNIPSMSTTAPKTLYTITEATTINKDFKANVSIAKCKPVTSKDAKKHVENDRDKNTSNVTSSGLQKKQSQETIQEISAFPDKILANSSSKKILSRQHTQREEQKFTVSNKDLKEISVTSQISKIPSTKEGQLVQQKECTVIPTKTVLESTRTDIIPTVKTSSNIITAAPIHSEIIAPSVAVASKLPVSTFKSTHMKSITSEPKSSVPSVTLKHLEKSSVMPPAKTMTTTTAISPVSTGLKTKPSVCSISAKTSASLGKSVPSSSLNITKSAVPEMKTSIPATSSTSNNLSKTTGKNMTVKASTIKTTANPPVAPKTPLTALSKPTVEAKKTD